MKKIVILCVICILLTVLPGTVSASSVDVRVTDVENDIVTVSGNVPADTPVTIVILNPGFDTDDIMVADGAIQYMKALFGKNGAFSCDVKMNTGTAPNKNEGVFSIFVSEGGNLIYSNESFVFYSNETKESFVNVVKTATKDELLAENGEEILLQKIYNVFSLSSHELYSAKDIEKLAKIITLQNERENIETPAEIEQFLLKVLVLCAFENGSSNLKEKDGLKYTDIWALENGIVSPFYSDVFKNDLNETGKKAVVNSMLSADYKGAKFDMPLKVFKETILYNIIMNNILMGTGHIEKYMLTDYKDLYETAGFDVEALAKIKSEEKKISKLEKVLYSNATDLTTLKDSFNKIINAKDEEKNNNSSSLKPSGGSSGGGGGGSATKPVQSPVPTQAPSITPEPSVPDESACPFTDMSGAEWARDAVDYLYKEGIVNGRSENTFAPNETVTRAEFAKMVMALVKEEPSKPQKDGVIKVACIGDSLTQGFVGEDGKYQSNTSYTDILQEMLGDGYEVKNFGKSAHGIYIDHQYSYTKTEEYNNSLQYEPDIVISVFGSNDMREIYWQDIKDKYTSIYTDFIKTYMALPSNPEIIIGLPGPVYDGEYIESRPQENQLQAQAAILKAAEELDVTVADTYNALSKEGSAILPDGLHFNSDGAQIFANTIFNAMTSKGENETEVTFNDVPESAWYYQVVSKAASKGIVNGYGDNFKPDDFISRQDATLIVYRALNLSGGGNMNFADANEISDYAKEAIGAMVENGYINGMGDGTFAPKATLTRAQAAQIIYNAIKGGAAI